MTETTTFFGDEDCVNFTQLSNGHWVGHNLFKTFTTIESFEKGSTGDSRFKHLEVRLSTDEEIEEHERILGWED